jgi:tyrosyl-tRNA synthetase
MSVPDSLVAKYFLLLTDKGAPSEDPYQAKLALAETLVRIAYGEAKAKRAREEFKHTFSQQGVPTDMPELKLPKKAKLTEALLISGIASKSEARRLIEQNAVQLNQETMPSDEEIIFSSGDILKVGKKKFFKVKI